MFKRSLSLVIVLALIFSVTPINHQNVSATRLSYQNIDSINQPANTANIGEVFAERAGFGFVRHELNVHNVKVKWIAKDGKVNGTVEMNYSIYHLFEKKIPRFMATGFSVYLHGKNLGKNSIFTLEREVKVYRGKLPVNVSFTCNGESHIVLYAKVWFAGFPPNPVAVFFYQNLTNHGLLNWLTFGAFDIKIVRIDIDIIEIIIILV